MRVCMCVRASSGRRHYCAMAWHTCIRHLVTLVETTWFPQSLATMTIACYRDVSTTVRHNNAPCTTHVSSCTRVCVNTYGTLFTGCSRSSASRLITRNKLNVVRSAQTCPECATPRYPSRTSYRSQTKPIRSQRRKMLFRASYLVNGRSCAIPV